MITPSCCQGYTSQTTPSVPSGDANLPRAQLTSQISCVSTRTTDTSPYECIDDYWTTEPDEESEGEETPPPLPRKRLSYTELRQEALYYSINNLIVALRDLEQKSSLAKRLSGDKTLTAAQVRVAEPTSLSYKQPGDIDKGAEGLLIDVGEEETGRMDADIPLPGYPAPMAPTTRRQSDAYLEPVSGTQTAEPVYAEIRKNHVKIEWS